MEAVLIGNTKRFDLHILYNCICFNSIKQDDFDCISNPGGRPVAGQGLNFHFIAANTTNNFEYLQSMLKQREGELAQTQWELSRVQVEKNVLQEELAQLSLEMENVSKNLLTIIIVLFE